MKVDENRLLEDIGKKRYDHSLRVANLAEKLALIYKVDSKKAYLAGLLHDCAKYNEKKYLELLNIDYKKYPVFSIVDPVLHSFLGADLAKKVYNINDKDILSAIEFHTTGKKDMTDLEKIIFVSDAVEEGRDFEGIDTFRELAFVDLDKAVLSLLDNNIKFLIRKKALINPLSIEARNFFIEENNEQTRNN